MTGFVLAMTVVAGKPPPSLTRLDRKPVTVDPAMVRPTNSGRVRKPWRLPDVPILTIRSGSCLYILDGNHRFYADRRLGHPVKAWILTPTDKNRVRGEISGWVRQWVEGRIGFVELRKRAVAAHREEKSRALSGGENAKETGDDAS